MLWQMGLEFITRVISHDESQAIKAFQSHRHSRIRRDDRR